MYKVQYQNNSLRRDNWENREMENIKEIIWVKFPEVKDVSKNPSKKKM